MHAKYIWLLMIVCTSCATAGIGIRPLDSVTYKMLDGASSHFYVSKVDTVEICELDTLSVEYPGLRAVLSFGGRVYYLFNNVNLGYDVRAKTPKDEPCIVYVDLPYGQLVLNLQIEEPNSGMNGSTAMAGLVDSGPINSLVTINDFRPKSEKDIMPEDWARAELIRKEDLEHISIYDASNSAIVHCSLTVVRDPTNRKSYLFELNEGGRVGISYKVALFAILWFFDHV